jgi:hypothetical protein
MVIVIGVGHDGVDPVVTAGHLEDHENGAIAPSRGLRRLVRRVRLQRGEGVGQEGRHRPRKRAGQDSVAQELAPRLESNVVFHIASDIAAARLLTI